MTLRASDPHPFEHVAREPKHTKLLFFSRYKDQQSRDVLRGIERTSFALFIAAPYGDKGTRFLGRHSRRTDAPHVRPKRHSA